ncbi:MAG TPA: ABC transporter ATP-binding protein, partial [Clostridia bacterium]|nr:ABC transporter ATP-binding protein [Clostridia bacterium]
MVSIREVSKTYGKKQVPAVDSLNLEIREGEIFGFIGPNGAGKTTTIKMLTGILPPDKGSIVIDGVDLVKNPVEAKMKIGYVPDNPNIYERLTGMEYLEFIGDVYGVPYAERRERINKYMKMFEMEFSFNDQIRSYSHGMRQKLLITGA